MKKIDTHGLKMDNLRKACSDTKGLRGCGGEYLELFYDSAAGEVWTKYQVSLGKNTWTVYNDSSVIKCGNVSSPATMQELSDLIFEAVCARRAYEEVGA